MKTNTIETPRSNATDYSDRIRLERTKRAWTQEKLAEETGISSRTIQRLECGDAPSAESLRRIAEAFGIPVEELKAKTLRKYFLIPSSKLGMIAVYIVLLAIIAVPMLVGAGAMGREFAWIDLFGMIYLLLNLVWFPRALVLRDGMLRVNKLFSSSKYDLSKLTGIRAAPYEMLMDSTGSVPLSPILSMGYGWSRSLGRFRAYLNDYKRSVLLEFGDEKIIVGPDNPEEFLESVRDEMRGVCADAPKPSEESGKEAAK